MKLFYKLSNIPIIGNKIKMLITNKTGGFQESNFIRKYTRDKYKVDIGVYSYGGCFLADFNIGGSVTIGKYCSFATNIHYFGASHPMHYVSMSPYFYNQNFSKNVKDVERSSLTIGNDCWIGFGVIITNKCHLIGNGVVVAAGSVVTRDIPAYAVVAGSPAKIIRYRFEEKIIEKIEQSQWWNKSPDECLKHYKDIDNPVEFCRRLNNVEE